MEKPLVVNEQVVIPAGELGFTFARSSGPGGQNVNKVNTKAVLRWNAAKSNALHAAMRERFFARFGNQVTNEGDIVIASDRHRYRMRNVNDCLERLRAMLLAVAAAPRRRRPTRVPRGANEARLKRKQQHSKKKQERRRRDFE